jgi:hypothetical protein
VESAEEKGDSYHFDSFDLEFLKGNLKCLMNLVLFLKNMKVVLLIATTEYMSVTAATVFMWSCPIRQ